MGQRLSDQDTAFKQSEGVVQASDLNEGDLIEFKRANGAYSHWGVYAGNDDVIHLSGDPDANGKFNFADMSANASVRQDKLRSVAGDSYTYRNNELDRELRPYGSEEIVKEAQKNLGKTGYNLGTYNCEHFATECRYGEARSNQVETVAQKAVDYFSPSPRTMGDPSGLLPPSATWAADRLTGSHGDRVQF